MAFGLHLLRQGTCHALCLALLGTAFAADVPEMPPAPPPPPPPRKARVPQQTQSPTATNAVQPNGIPNRSSNGLVATPAQRALRPNAPPRLETNLVWDALMKEYSAKEGETNATLSFSLTNASPKEVTITSVGASCGCSVPKLPTLPWKLAPQASGSFDVALDLRGKSGVLTKTLLVETSEGNRHLTMRVLLPASAPSALTLSDRAKNLQVALTDRQAVFKGDCAACHLQPGMGKRGKDLYVSICGVCHEAEHRASMVPNLRTLKHSGDKSFWNNIIEKGKPNRLMPAFAVSEAGPLSPDQIRSLVDYLTGPFQLEKAAPPTPSGSKATAP